MVDGSKIRAARLTLKEATASRKGSQTWLAAQIGAHVTSISKWEAGKHSPSSRHLQSIASALGVSVDSLYTEVDE